MSSTPKNWFKGGFWRTNHGYEKLFLVFVFVLVALLGSGGGAPLPEGRDVMRADNTHHSDPQGYPATGVHVATAVRYGRRHPRGRSRHGRTTAIVITPRPPRATPPPPCFEDPGAKAYLAGTVFEGKARSRSPLRNGAYNVTFVVQEVFKGGEVGFTRSPVRLQFLEKKGDGTECASTPGPLVRANIKRGGKYIVFVDKVGPHSFIARGQPALKTQANLTAVKDVLCHNCVRKTSMSRMDDVTLKAQEKLRLVCRVRGNPPPLLHWYKDGVRVVAGKGTTVKIRNKKRRTTTLAIPRVKLEDAGVYECRATSVTGAVERVKSQVTVTHLTRQETTTDSWRYATHCPIDHFCMNDGRCTYYEAVGEMLCLCAEGFKGTRCDEKDVYDRANGSMYRPMSYFCKLGLSASYYC